MTLLAERLACRVACLRIFVSCLPSAVLLPTAPRSRSITLLNSGITLRHRVVVSLRRHLQRGLGVGLGLLRGLHGGHAISELRLDVIRFHTLVRQGGAVIRDELDELRHRAQQVRRLDASSWHNQFGLALRPPRLRVRCTPTALSQLPVTPPTRAGLAEPS